MYIQPNAYFQRCGCRRSDLGCHSERQGDHLVFGSWLQRWGESFKIALYQRQPSDDDTHQGEALPFQGGTNEVVVAKMFKDLEPERRKLFRVFWYTGKCTVPKGQKVERLAELPVWIQPKICVGLSTRARSSGIAMLRL
jgi:hypothetical protein